MIVKTNTILRFKTICKRVQKMEIPSEYKDKLENGWNAVKESVSKVLD